jgi:hypothetical protein
MIYEICNINKFAKSLGKIVAKDIGFSTKELKSYIKVSNIKNIIIQHSNGMSNGKLTIDEKNTKRVYNEILNWLVGSELAKLASENVLDCYWDDKKNTMMFSYSKEQNDGEKI